MNAGKFDRERLRIEAKCKGRGKRWRKKAMQHLVEDSGAEVVSTGKRIIGYKLPDGTTACQKRRFATEDDALDVLRQIAAEPEPRKKPIRAYPCFVCCGWHFTSSPRDVA